MKENQGKTDYVNEPVRFNELLLSGMYKVSARDLFKDDVMAVQFKFDDGFVEINAFTKVNY